MKVTFDPEKAIINYRKHGIRLADGETVLYDPPAVKAEDKDADGEQRLKATGYDALERLLVVVYMYRGDDEIRLISARKARRKEQREYHGK